MKKGLTIFGIIVFLLGSICILYKAQLTPEKTIGGHWMMGYWIPVTRIPATYHYPYQTIGLILAVAGIIVTVLGFLKK